MSTNSSDDLNKKLTLEQSRALCKGLENMADFILESIQNKKWYEQEPKYMEGQWNNSVLLQELNEVRKKQKVSIKSLAAKAEINKNTLSSLLAARNVKKNNPELLTLNRIAKALNVRITIVPNETPHCPIDVKIPDVNESLMDDLKKLIIKYETSKKTRKSSRQ